MRVKKGDIVGRKSYNKDILFIVDRIINNENVLLKGLNIRIIADSTIDDIERISKNKIIESIKQYRKDEEKRIEIDKMNKRIYTGKVLHLDGDRKYSEKSAKYYNKMGVVSIVKNIAESKQPKVVIPLLNKYNPDILIITGHDAMLKKGTNYNNIYNYRNSRFFISTVKQARTWGKTSDKLVIFARRMPKLL